MPVASSMVKTCHCNRGYPSRVWFHSWVVLFTATVGPIAAQQTELPRAPGIGANPFLKDEAPPTLFSLDRNDAEVDLFVLGDWIATSRVSTGIALHPKDQDGNRVTFPYLYPGFESVLFDQTVDLTLSLWLYERYFFETTFEQSGFGNSLALGYLGRPGERVQEVIVGNTQVTMSQYPYLYTGSKDGRLAATALPALKARFQGRASEHELLLQIENTSLERVRIVGGGRANNARIPVSRYLRGRGFVLPDGGIDAGVTVLIEDRRGSVLSADGSRRFRVAGTAEAVVDRDDGLLRLKEDPPADAIVAVYYEVGGTPVGDASLGRNALVQLDLDQTPTDLLENFDFGRFAGLRLDLADGRGALVLRRRGEFSRFEVANLYRVPTDARGAVDAGRAAIRLVQSGSTQESTLDITLSALDNGNVLQLQTGAGPRTRDFQYPVATAGATEATIYGPIADSRARAAGLELLLEYVTKTDKDEIILDGDIVPGTLQVTADGVAVNGVALEAGSNRVLLPRSAQNAAVIDVTYRVYDPTGGNDVVAQVGNRWHVDDGFQLTAAAGTRWTLRESEFSESAGEHPGLVVTSLGASYESERFAIDTSLGLRLRNPDTSGLLRLFDGEDSVLSFAALPTNVFPSAPSAQAGASAASRVVPRYRDYYSSSFVDDTALGLYTQDVAANATGNGTAMGPYLARSADSGFSGTVAVLEWDALATGEWVNAEIRVEQDPLDLSGSDSVQITYRVLDATASDLRFTLEAGTLDEDIDRDRTADLGASPVDPTFAFTLSDGFRLAGIQAPNLTRAHREDQAGDGILAGEANPAPIIDNEAPTGGGWVTKTIDLTTAERSALASTNAVRLTVKAPDGANAGRVLLGKVAFRRDSLPVVVTTGSGAAGSHSRVDSPAAPVLGGTALVDQFPAVAGSLNRSTNRVAEVTWPATATEVQVFVDLAAASLRDYKQLGLYLGIDPDSSFAADDTVRITLGSFRGDRNAASASIAAGDLVGRWHEVVARDGGLWLDGTRVTGFDTDIPNEIGVVRIDLRNNAGTGGGKLFVDEAHLSGTRVQAAVGGDIDTTIRGDLGPGTWRIDQSITAYGPRFESTLQETSVLDSTTGVTIGLDRHRLGATVGVANGRHDSVELSGGHSATFELNAIRLNEDFRHDPVNTSTTRSGSVTVRGRAFTTGLSGTVLRSESSLRQDWVGTFRLTIKQFLASLSADAGIDSDRDGFEHSYARAWIGSWRNSMNFAQPGDRLRRGGGDISVEYDFGRFDLALVSGAGFNASPDRSGTQSSSASVALHSGIDIGGTVSRPWRLGPFYRRDYRTVRDSTSNSYHGDVKRWADAIDTQRLLMAPPLSEFWREAGDLALAPSAARSETGHAELGVSIRRAPGSRLSDLIVPKSARVSVLRTTAVEATSVDDSYTTAAVLTTRALNLFGTQGTMPRFTRVTTDEYRIELEASQTSRRPSDGNPRRRFSAAIRAEFFAPRQRTLSVNLNLAVDPNGSVAQGSGVVFGRQRAPGARVDRLVPDDVPATWQFDLSVDQNTRFTSGSFVNSEVLLGQDVALLIGEYGRIALFGKLGWRINRVAAGYFHIIGLASGIEGSLSY